MHTVCEETQTYLAMGKGFMSCVCHTLKQRLPLGFILQGRGEGSRAWGKA
jgi:hypothetical protein